MKVPVLGVLWISMQRTKAIAIHYIARSLKPGTHYIPCAYLDEFAVVSHVRTYCTYLKYRYRTSARYQTRKYFNVVVVVGRNIIFITSAKLRLRVYASRCNVMNGYVSYAPDLEADQTLNGPKGEHGPLEDFFFLRG